MATPDIDEYMSLIQEFIEGSLTANQFEKKYLNLFKSDEKIRDEKIFLVLDRLFSDVDVFCADPKVRKTSDLDENGLREAACNAYDKLKGLL